MLYLCDYSCNKAIINNRVQITGTESFIKYIDDTRLLSK